MLEPGSPSGSSGPSVKEIQSFWERHPVGSDLVPETELREFFEAYDRFRDRTEGHIRREIRQMCLEGAEVLEIGLGQGTDSQRLAGAARRYTGVDLTPESIRRVGRRFDLFGVHGARLALMNAESLGFRDASFDVVYSHGVIHHSPRIERIVSEIHRVLRPGGRAVVMVYHRHSLNYQLSIRVFRRLGIFALALPGVARAISGVTGEPPHRLHAHTKNLRQQGLRYLRMENFIHASTDGPHNVFSSVWSEREARALFSAFSEVALRRHFLNERHLPPLRLLGAKAKGALASRVGWHLWILARK
jgi:ubiquinone/menaquinone biosynthesis C-methylase UbiE